MSNMLTSFIPSIAKAIVAAVMPFIVIGAAWLADSAGINVDIDVSVLEAAVVSVLGAAATYIVRNKPVEAEA